MIQEAKPAIDASLQSLLLPRAQRSDFLRAASLKGEAMNIRGLSASLFSILFSFGPAIAQPGSSVVDPNDIKVATTAALKNCKASKFDSSGLCTDSVNKTVKYLQSFERQNQDDTKRIELMLQEARRDEEAIKKKCQAGDKRSCREIVVAEAKRRQLQQSRNRLGDKSMKHRATVVKRLSSLNNLLKENEPRFVAIVKVRPTGRVRVVPSSSLIAYYDDYMLYSILADLHLLADRLGVTELTPAVSCPQGTWKAFPASQWKAMETKFGMLGALKQLTSKTGVSELTDLCDKSSDGDSGSGGGVAGFTGVSGFDMLGPLSCAASSPPTPAKMMEDLNKKMADMQQACGDIRSTMSEGTDTSATPTVVSTSAETKKDDAGNTTTTTTTTYSDGSVKKHVQTKDSSGNVTHNGRQTQTDTDGDGTLDKTVVNVATPDGKGGTDHTVIVNDKNGFDMHTYKTKSGDWRVYDQVQIFHMKWKTCVDETCTSCQSAAHTATVMALKCAGSSSGICKGFSAANSCCGEAGGGFFDPTIAIPNQDEAFACRISSSAPGATEACKKRCMVATDLNCEASCNLGTPGQVPFDVADMICRYAYSEDCFASDVAIPLPPGRSPTPGPQPIPTLFSNHFLLETCNPDTQTTPCAR